MHNEILKKYIENPKILYLYEIGLQVYGLFTDVEDRDFLIICDNDYKNDDFPSSTFIEENEFGQYHFRVIPIKIWFQYVLNGDLLAWECACLNKKFIYKEHVKLLLQTNPLQLRKAYESNTPDLIQLAINNINNDCPISGQKTLWSIVKYVIFSNQIIENHKIVKFKEVVAPYQQIVNGQVSDSTSILATFEKELEPHLERFKKYTDGMLAKSKLKFINQDA